MAAKQRLDARAFKDLPIGEPNGGPIDLRRPAAKSDGKAPTGASDSRSSNPSDAPFANRSAEHQLVFDSLADCYQAAIAEGSDEAWRKVKDYVMTNLGALVMTRLTTFRDLMNLTLEIDARLKGKAESQGTLKKFEDSWVLADVKKVE